MKEPEEMSGDDIREMLAKSWLTHDGTWFMSAFQQLGIERANELNLSAIKTLAPLEIARVRRLLGVGEGELDDFEGVRDFLRRALDLTMPRSVISKARFWSPSEGVLRWEWADGECFAFKGMQMLGAAEGYQCGVMFRIACWLEGLGIDYEMVPEIEGCLMQQTGKCAGEFRMKM